MNTIFKRGVPTDADVNELQKAYPISALSAGAEIPYADIERLLRISKRGSRFQTVTNRWRGALEREGIFFKCVPGDKFVVCDNAGKADLAGQKGREALKKAKKSAKISAFVDRKALDEDRRKAFDNNQIFAAAVIGLQQVKRTAELPTI